MNVKPNLRIGIDFGVVPNLILFNSEKAPNGIVSAMGWWEVKAAII